MLRTSEHKRLRLKSRKRRDYRGYVPVKPRDLLLRLYSEDQREAIKTTRDAYHNTMNNHPLH